MLEKKYSQSELQAAIEIVLETGGISFELVNHFLEWAYQEDKKSETLFFQSGSPLAKVEIPPPSAAHYEMLMGR